jgi:hypothetical protein
MITNLITEYVSTDEKAKTLLLFGGNAERRHEIISLLQPLTNLSVFGVLSEVEGIEKMKTLAKVDFLLIGGRYNEEERVRIRSFIHTNYPGVQITEPGYHYAYSNQAIFNNIQKMVNNETAK